MNKIIEEAYKEDRGFTIILFVIFFIAIIYMFQQFMTGGKLFYG